MFSTLETAYSSVLDSINWAVFIFTRSYVGNSCECYKRGCFEKQLLPNWECEEAIFLLALIRIWQIVMQSSFNRVAL